MKAIDSMLIFSLLPVIIIPTTTAIADVEAMAILSRIRLGMEIKTHYRKSYDNRFATSFPFKPEELPIGESNSFLETVNAGYDFIPFLMGLIAMIVTQAQGIKKVILTVIGCVMDVNIRRNNDQKALIIIFKWANLLNLNAKMIGI